MLVKGMSVVLQQGLKQMLLKHCDFIVSSVEVGGSGVKWTSLLGANEALAGIVGF